MKGLIIKDILNLKNYMKQLILVLIFFIAYGIFLKIGTFVGTMITLMLSMQVITTMSYDEYAKWDKYALTMNINRKDIVLSKYVFFIMSIIIGMVVGVISSMTINQILQSDINMNDGTVEGLKYLKKDIYTVQFHPEACPGPEDNSYIFDEFIERVINKKENQNAKK